MIEEKARVIKVVRKPRNYKIDEAAKELRTSRTTISNFIKDGLIKALNMPNGKIIPDFEIERFRKWALENQIDLSGYGKGERKTC